MPEGSFVFPWGCFRTKLVFPERLQFPGCGGRRSVPGSGRNVPARCRVLGGQRAPVVAREVFPPGGSVLLEVQRRSVLEYVWVRRWGLGETLDVKFQGSSPCWSEKQWKQFAVCFFIPFTSVPWGSRKGLLVWTDGVAGRAGNPTAPVAPSSDLAAGRKAHSQVSSPGSVTRTGATTELVPSLGPGALVLEQPKPAWAPLVLPVVWMSGRLLFSSVLG
ncbi:uncharacterized protein [Aphelocoma coerulescens]|uniref:uncharacterized protein isoform X1 n=1 Tax=Aphelocoma coerulescens TaxID=39617 RepID=UPI003604D756